jgi:hypothetical protein
MNKDLMMIDAPITTDNRDREFYRSLYDQKQLKPDTKLGYVRVSGLILGALGGLIYCLVSQLVNTSSLPGIPLYFEPFGFTGNLAVSVIAGALLGLICAWPRNSVAGVGLAGLGILVAFLSNAILIRAFSLAYLQHPIITLLTFLSLGFSFLFLIPLMFVFRWVLRSQHDYSDEPLTSWFRLRSILTLLILLSLVGVLNQYSNETSEALKDMKTLVQYHLKTSGPARNYMDLKDNDFLIDFRQFANSNYLLSPVYDDQLISDLHYFAGFDGEVITASFDGGWKLACVFNRQLPATFCKGYLPEVSSGNGTP